jgi:hypothetical protein
MECRRGFFIPVRPWLTYPVRVWVSEISVHCTFVILVSEILADSNKKNQNLMFDIRITNDCDVHP